MGPRAFELPEHSWNMLILVLLLQVLRHGLKIGAAPSHEVMPTRRTLLPTTTPRHRRAIAAAAALPPCSSPHLPIAGRDADLTQDLGHWVHSLSVPVGARPVPAVATQPRAELAHECWLDRWDWSAHEARRDDVNAG